MVFFRPPFQSALFSFSLLLFFLIVLSVFFTRLVRDATPSRAYDHNATSTSHYRSVAVVSANILLVRAARTQLITAAERNVLEVNRISSAVRTRWRGKIIETLKIVITMIRWNFVDNARVIIIVISWFVFLLRNRIILLPSLGNRISYVY